MKAQTIARPRQKSKLLPVALGAAAVAAILILPELATANSATTGMPWESGLTKIKNSLTGPVAGIIAVIALAAAGWQLVWGGEMSDFSRKLLMAIMAIALLVGGASLIELLFGSGAVIS